MNPNKPAHLFSVAPMLDWTDRHCRFFHRLLSKQALLYTEMVTTGALIHGDHHRFLNYHPSEHPLVLQLGGSNPRELALCCKMAEDYGYDEVNLNLGCPSERVQNGRFGACLMAEPELVAVCIEAMVNATALPITAKCRIGIDERDSYAALHSFIKTLSAAGCGTFIIHARKAWLSGLSPKQNREVPPLRYDIVFQLKNDFPKLLFILNGGVTDLAQVDSLLTHLDGVMMGREAYQNPYVLAAVDQCVFGKQTPVPTREETILQLLPYLCEQLSQGVRLNSVTRHILGLFHGQPGARAWRRHLSEHACKPGADETVLVKALSFTQHAVS
jgi:tRNA-dihydrouridine synthase A